MNERIITVKTQEWPHFESNKAKGQHIDKNPLVQKPAVNGQFAYEISSEKLNRRETKPLSVEMVVREVRDDIYKKQRRLDNLRFASLVKRVSDNYVNADGTFQVDAIQQNVSYFQDHPDQLIKLQERKLSERSGKRQWAMLREKDERKKREQEVSTANKGITETRFEEIRASSEEHSHAHHGHNHSHDHETHEHSHDNPAIRESVELGVSGVLTENLLVESIRAVRRGKIPLKQIDEPEQLDHIRAEIATLQTRLGEKWQINPEEEGVIISAFVESQTSFPDKQPVRYLRKRIKKVSHDDAHANGDCEHHGKKGIVTRMKGMGPAVICALDCYGPAIMHATGQFLDGLIGGGAPTDDDHHHEDPAKVLTPQTRIVRQLPRRKEEEELALGRTTITFPADTKLSQKDMMIPTNVQGFLPEPLSEAAMTELPDDIFSKEEKEKLMQLIQEEPIHDPGRSLTWLDRQSMKLFAPLLKERKKEKKVKSKKKRLRTAVVATTSLVVLGGIAGGSIQPSLEDSKSDKSSSNASQDIATPEKPVQGITEKPDPQKMLTRSIVIHAGDSQWGIAENLITDSGYESSVPVTNIITDLIAAENIKQAPCPDSLTPGRELNVPTKEIITVIFDALDHSSEKKLSQAEELFARNVNKLNNLTPISKGGVVTTQKERLSEITQYLASQLNR